MKPADRKTFGPVVVTLKDGRKATVRPLLGTDGDALAAFYASVPPGDYRFYCPHPLDREHALANAAKADSPFEIVLVAEGTKKEIGGYAWLRWDNEKADRSTFGICVRQAYQGSGVGRALATRLFAVGRKLAPPVIQLTVQKANQRGVSLYTSLGFKVVREQIRPAGFQPGLAAELEYAMERQERS